MVTSSGRGVTAHRMGQLKSQTAALPPTHLDGPNRTDYNNIDHLRASFKMFGFAWRAAGCVVVMAQALLLFILGLVTPSMEVSQWWMGVEPVNLHPLFQI